MRSGKGQGQEESSFCEQKEAKKLWPFGGGRDGGMGFLRRRACWLRRLMTPLSGYWRSHGKSFLLLFFKKEDSSFLPLAFRSSGFHVYTA
jgi:hypothetical protein